METIPSYAETEALLQVLREFPGMNAWVSFTLKDEKHISDGTSLRKVADLLNREDQIIAIGVNCVSEGLAEKALAILHEHTSKPLVVYPNSGEVYDATTKTWSGEESGGSSLQEKARRWHSLGARLIGGCCRTTPESIRTIRNALR
jgi:homocysteine S-methyltransferase